MDVTRGKGECPFKDKPHDDDDDDDDVDDDLTCWPSQIGPNNSRPN